MLTEHEIAADREARHSYRDRIEELEAKLAKAVAFLEMMKDQQAYFMSHGIHLTGDAGRARYLLAELKEEDDE